MPAVCGNSPSRDEIWTAGWKGKQSLGKGEKLLQTINILDGVFTVRILHFKGTYGNMFALMSVPCK